MKTSQINVIEDVSKMPLETMAVESANAKVESTTLVDKGNIPREQKHNASYSKNLHLGNPDDKIQKRSSLQKQACLALVSQMEPK